MTKGIRFRLTPDLAWTIKTLINQERFHVARDLRDDPNDDDREYMQRLNKISRMFKRRLLHVPNPNLKFEPNEESNGTCAEPAHQDRG